MTQPSLFDELPQVAPRDYYAVPVRSHVRRVKGTAPAPTAPHNGTQTSRVAAAVVAESGTSATYRARVLECIKNAGARGITRADIERRTSLAGNTVRPRVYELLGKQKDTSGSYPAPLIEELEEARIPDCGGKIRQKVLRAL